MAKKKTVSLALYWPCNSDVKTMIRRDNNIIADDVSASGKYADYDMISVIA